MATFLTILDFGGQRLAITGDGKSCFAAAYHAEGVAAYSTADGSTTWRRKDLKKTQKLSISLDDKRVFACFDDRACQILNRETGKTIKTWNGVREVWESPYQPFTLVAKQTLDLKSHEERKIASIPRETFAVLCVAFAPGLVCIAESGGPLRCLDTKSGQERWRFAVKGEHILAIAFAEHATAFVGVSWPYESGGSYRLLRFDPECGEMLVVSDLGKSADFAFCQRGTRLLLSDGSVVDSATGRRERKLAFPESAS